MFENGETQMALHRMNGFNGGLNFNTPIRNGMYTFSGNCIQFQSNIDNLRDFDAAQIRDANLSIAGTQIKSPNMSCYLTTIIIGAFLVIPFLLMCFDWWKKIAFPVYQIPITTYRNITDNLLKKAKNIKNLTLMIIDSTFNKEKAKILYECFSNSSLKGFTFLNYSHPINYKQNEYDEFLEYMSPFKKLPLMYEIRWGNQIVL